ncbi:hypothetical protein EB796_017967 [Bugula neritina]|uniref:Uncharacterized protein n=1 Tax=Bugula neritina TaxID=10212 RepID=A0A7J7JDL2_BUGNE|nr:hypothetical protein EB796_017967 [Bugula neritina]
MALIQISYCLFILAVKKGLVSVVELLLSNGASPELLEQSTGCTALQISLIQLMNSTSETQIKLYEETSLAILNCADVDVTNCGLSGSSPLQMSILTQKPHITLAIISKASSRLTRSEINEAAKLLDNDGPQAYPHYKDVRVALETFKQATSKEPGDNCDLANHEIKNAVKSETIAKKAQGCESSVSYNAGTMREQAEHFLHFL